MQQSHKICPTASYLRWDMRLTPTTSQLTMLCMLNMSGDLIQAPPTQLSLIVKFFTLHGYFWCLIIIHTWPSSLSVPLYSPLKHKLLNRSKCKISPAMIWKENDEREPGELLHNLLDRRLTQECCSRVNDGIVYNDLMRRSQEQSTPSGWQSVTSLLRSTGPHDQTVYYPIIIWSSSFR